MCTSSVPLKIVFGFKSGWNRSATFVDESKTIVDVRRISTIAMEFFKHYVICLHDFDIGATGLDVSVVWFS